MAGRCDLLRAELCRSSTRVHPHPPHRRPARDLPDRNSIPAAAGDPCRTFERHGVGGSAGIRRTRPGPSDPPVDSGRALGNPLALLELPRAFRLQGTDGREGTLRSIPLTDRLERTFSAQAGQVPTLTQAALLLIALDKDPTVSDVLAATRKQV